MEDSITTQPLRPAFSVGVDKSYSLKPDVTEALSNWYNAFVPFDSAISAKSSTTPTLVDAVALSKDRIPLSAVVIPAEISDPIPIGSGGISFLPTL